MPDLSGSAADIQEGEVEARLGFGSIAAQRSQGFLDGFQFLPQRGFALLGPGMGVARGIEGGALLFELPRQLFTAALVSFEAGFEVGRERRPSGLVR
jgi:hypothetical protein